MIDAIQQFFRQPEYIHVLLNPLPIYGLAVATLALLLALVRRNRNAQTVALVLIFLTAASAFPVAHYGEVAYDNVFAFADINGQAWLEAHRHAADRLVYFFYALALLAAVTIFAPKKWLKSATPLTIATLLLAFCSLGAGGYIGYLGGKIRHREFRTGPPPKKIEP